jgi:hypothetical protein
LPLSMLMSEDLPTLLLPMKAYSGLSGFGALSTEGLEITYAACLIFMLQSNKAYIYLQCYSPGGRGPFFMMKLSAGYLFFISLRMPSVQFVRVFFSASVSFAFV